MLNKFDKIAGLYQKIGGIVNHPIIKINVYRKLIRKSSNNEKPHTSPLSNMIPNHIIKSSVYKREERLEYSVELSVE